MTSESNRAEEYSRKMLACFSLVCIFCDNCKHSCKICKWTLNGFSAKHHQPVALYMVVVLFTAYFPPIRNMQREDLISSRKLLRFFTLFTTCFCFLLLPLVFVSPEAGLNKPGTAIGLVQVKQNEAGQYNCEENWKIRKE